MLTCGGLFRRRCSSRGLIHSEREHGSGWRFFFSAAALLTLEISPFLKLMVSCCWRSASLVEISPHQSTSGSIASHVSSLPAYAVRISAVALEEAEFDRFI